MTGLDDIVEICDYQDISQPLICLVLNSFSFSFRNMNVVPHDNQIVKNGNFFE